MERGRFRYPAGPLLLTVALPAVALAFLTGGRVLRSGLVVTSTVVSIVAILIGLRIHRSADRLPWLLVVAAMALMTGVNAIGLVDALRGVASPDTPLNELLQAAGYLALLAAAVVVVMRHAPHDRGGVIDAALIGLGIAAPVWEFILRPRLLANGASLPSQAVVLVQILVLLAVLGALLRISRTSERGQTALRYLFAALACTIVGLVLSGATTDPETGRQLPLVGVLWIWGYLFLAAAGLHPSAAYFVVPSGWRATAPGGIRLGHLGLVLLVEQATRDHLTGLANRRHLFEQLDGAVRRHAEGFGPAVTLLFCDLDDFKPVNDRWGHDAGDHVLRVVAQRLVACVRAGDVVGRIGGDEFLVLCPGAGPDEAARLRERITLALVEPVTWRGRSIHVGVTIGLATSAGTAVSADTLVAAADAQMYARKRANKVRPAEYVATRSPA
jgi:diguanylate cyclase (GGDEF)-like protein